MVQDNWLEDAKSERGLKMTHQDKKSRDICLAYLFLLSVCNSEGFLKETGFNTTNVTLH